MSCNQDLAGHSSDSSLEDSYFPDAKNAKSAAAKLGHLRRKAKQTGLSAAANYPLVTPQVLFPAANTSNTLKTSPSKSKNSLTLYERVDLVLAALRDNNLTLSDFVRTTCASDYANQRASTDIGFKLSSQDASETEKVRTWAKDIALQAILQEASEMEAQKVLHTKGDALSVEWLKNWSPNTVHKHLSKYMPYFVSILSAFVSRGDINSLSRTKQDKLPVVISITGSILWNLRSQKANYLAKGLAPYFYASGVHASTINVLNRIGISMSYSSLLRGLDALNDSCVSIFQNIAANCESFYMWDNINWTVNHAEQRLKSAGIFDSGTAATLVEFHPPPGCGPEFIALALDLEAYFRAQDSAQELRIEDLSPTLEDEAELRSEFVYEVMDVLILYGGDHFKKYKEFHKLSDATLASLLPPRITKAYPLPTFHLEQASANGNATVTEEIRRVTKVDKSPRFKVRATVGTGDLLTVKRLESLLAVRTLGMRTNVHVEDPHENMRYMVSFSGLFHTRMAGATAILQVHFGTPNARPQDGPASLWRHNELLKRKNIAPSQKVDYRTGQDLIFHSLYARLLDIVRVEAECDSLDALGQELNLLSPENAWKRVQSIALSAVTRFTTPNKASGDDVLRNSILFIRDALIFRSFVRAIKIGNIPAIVRILKIWAIAFRGAGRAQYATELLRFRHNILYAWPESLTKLILTNMLVNTTGRPDGWKETDLLQEHLNYWIKLVYKAHGANASWKWLGNISTCIIVLRELARSVDSSLSPWNSTRHSSPNLQADIDTLLKSLIEDKVHTYDPARTFSTPSLRAKDVIEIGFQQLNSTGPNSPLGKFNSTRLGARQQATDPEAHGAPPSSNAQSRGDTTGEGRTRADTDIDVPPDEDVAENEIELVIADEEDSEPFGLDL